MELKVYDWEIFDRSKIWFLLFALFILVIVVFSILSSNIIGWVLVLVVAWAYVYYITKTSDTIKITIWEKALQIWNVIFQYKDLSWFVLEYHTQKQKIYNIVIIDNKNEYRIYTINDSDENLENFVNELNNYIPMLEKYEQTTMDKFIRKLKL